MPVKRRIDPRTGEDLDFKVLRQSFDSNDPFMRGHGLTKARTGSRKRGVPEWANDSNQVRALIRASFPNAYKTPAQEEVGYQVSECQRRAAGRWAMIIYLYFVNKYSAKETAQEMRLMEDQVRAIIRSIRRAVSGRRADNGEPRVRMAPVQYDNEIMPLSY